MMVCGSPYAQKQIIFDTDFGGDADDLGALAMLNHFQNKGEAELLGVFCWNAEQYAVSGIDAVNTYYGNPDIPIGLRQVDPHLTDWNHSKVLADYLPHDVTFDNAPDATALYRNFSEIWPKILINRSRKLFKRSQSRGNVHMYNYEFLPDKHTGQSSLTIPPP